MKRCLWHTLLICKLQTVQILFLMMQQGRWQQAVTAVLLHAEIGASESFVSQQRFSPSQLKLSMPSIARLLMQTALPASIAAEGLEGRFRHDQVRVSQELSTSDHTWHVRDGREPPGLSWPPQHRRQ